MSVIKVKGLQIRGDDLKPTIDVDFNQLSSKGQKRIFLKNKDLFLQDALDSEYERIRCLPIKYIEEYSVDTINDVLEQLSIRDIYTWIASEKYEFIIAVIKNEKIKIKEKTIERLAYSDFWGIKMAIAERKDVSFEMLCPIFFRSIKEYLEYDETKLLEAVVTHPNFYMNTTIERAIIKSYSPEIVKKITEKISSFTSKN